VRRTFAKIAAGTPSCQATQAKVRRTFIHLNSACFQPGIQALGQGDETLKGEFRLVRTRWHGGNLFLILNFLTKTEVNPYLLIMLVNAGKNIYLLHIFSLLTAACFAK
jgi:hypothetical protein